MEPLVHPKSFLVGTIAGFSVQQIIQKVPSSTHKYTIHSKTNEQKNTISPVTFIIHKTHQHSIVKLQTFDYIYTMISTIPVVKNKTSF